MTTATDTTSLIFEMLVLWVFAPVRYTKSRLWGSDGKRFRLVRVDPKKGAKSWTIGPLVRWKLLKRSVLCKLLVLRLPCLACQPIHPHIWFCSMKPSNWKPKSLCVPQKVWWLSPVQVRDSRIPGPLCSRNFRNMMIIYDHLFSVLQFWCYQFSWWYPQTTTFFSPTNHLE